MVGRSLQLHTVDSRYSGFLAADRTLGLRKNNEPGKESFSKRFEQEWEKLECGMDALGALRPQLPELASASGERMRWPATISFHFLHSFCLSFCN